MGGHMNYGDNVTASLIITTVLGFSLIAGLFVQWAIEKVKESRGAKRRERMVDESLKGEQK